MDERRSVFESIHPDRHVLEGKRFFVIEDSYPVSPGHCLIVSRERRVDYFELDRAEREELAALIPKVREWIEQRHSPDGYNIGMNCGAAAGQTVMHFHCHVIPRYTGDMDNPAGGVRHCVRGKGYYDTEGAK